MAAVAERSVTGRAIRTWVRIARCVFVEPNELSGGQRQDARPGQVKIYGVPPARARWPAVGAPLERGVRRHCYSAALFTLSGSAGIGLRENAAKADLETSASLSRSSGTVSIAFANAAEFTSSCHGLPCVDDSTSRSGASSSLVKAESKSRDSNAGSMRAASFRYPS